ncbi:MAG: DNA-processing protein DprA [Lachnospiraceae bacterium]|nr:DNA-processing protein DprA [Lachnospiraceae bacterium]
MKIENDDIYLYILKKSGLTNRLALKLCKLFKNCRAIFEIDPDQLLFKGFGMPSDECPENMLLLNFNDAEIAAVIKILNKARDKENILIEEAKMFYDEIISKDIKWTGVFMDDYPKRLLDIPDPPMILYYKGRVPKEDKPCVSIIGARECSPYGEKTATMFAKELSISGVQIISGLARGIDGIAQRNSIKAGGSTFGVLGCGVDVIYPKENDDIFNDILINGGLLSEFEPGTQPLRQYFPSRNRIISGLSDIVLVVEARKRSGTYITVTQALEQGREVYAVPGRITDALSDGCNNLIASGAGVAVDPNAVLEELREIFKKNKINNVQTSEFKETVTSGNADLQVKNTDKKGSIGKTYVSVKESLAERIISALSYNDMSLDGLYLMFNEEFTIEDMSVALIDLETEGRIKKRGNKYFAN